MGIWERFAKIDAEFYILLNEEVDYRSSEGQEYFFDSGVEDTEQTLERAKSHIMNWGRALEIGCGIGRLAYPHSRHFRELYVVDISKTMINRLQAIAKEKLIENIWTFLPHERWDEPNRSDYIYSFLVFQHIEDFSIIESYIHRIALSLRHNGIAQLQFDTRPRSLFYNIRNLIPDFLLSRTQRRGIRRIRRSPDDLRKLFLSQGLTIIAEYDPISVGHTFLLSKT